MPRFFRLWIAIAIAACTLVPAAGRAQARSNGGSIPVTLEVLWPPLTAVGTRPLTFGFIPVGATSVTVLPNTPRSGEYRITGIRNRTSISIRLTLPPSLSNGRGGTLPLDFNGDYAANCEIDPATNGCDPVTYVAWNPVTQPTFNDTPDRARRGRPRYDGTDFTIYVGGRVVVPATAPAGVYTGRVTVTLVVN
jgi:hypothetical protein